MSASSKRQSGLFVPARPVQKIDGQIKQILKPKGNEGEKFY